MAPRPTPSQTTGPFFHDALLTGRNLSELVPPGEPGAIRITGAVYDGAGAVVPDAMIEVWQADRDGRFDHPDDGRGFTGFGRAGTTEGTFAFTTVKPGCVPGAGGMQAPHISVSVFARGLLKRVVTRIYFPDEGERNAADPVLSSIRDRRLRGTLISCHENGSLRFDIHLQGDGQTAFFGF